MFPMISLFAKEAEPEMGAVTVWKSGEERWLDSHVQKNVIVTGSKTPASFYVKTLFQMEQPK